MFGYIQANNRELKIKDFETYRSYYCGLCHTLKKRYGRRGQLLLNYDMTFLALVLTGLYEPEEEAPASGIRPEIKEAIDAYEAFVDEYCAFIETVNEDPTNAELLAAYIEYVDKLEEEERKMDALDKDLTEEEEDYYIEVLDRCNKKIMETAVELDA